MGLHRKETSLMAICKKCGAELQLHCNGVPLYVPRSVGAAEQATQTPNDVQLNRPRD